MSERLTLDQIQAAEDITEREVEIPEWGGNVLVKSITKRGLDEIRRIVPRNEEGEPDEDELQKALFMHGVLDPKFDDAAYEMLAEKSYSAFVKIIRAINSASSIGEKALTAKERDFPA